nr:MAG TPA: hypothetical protein [Caudoviricetes sp.]
MYIYNIQYVIDKCYHSCSISKILNILQQVWATQLYGTQ